MNDIGNVSKVVSFSMCTDDTNIYNESVTIMRVPNKISIELRKESFLDYGGLS